MAIKVSFRRGASLVAVLLLVALSVLFAAKYRTKIQERRAAVESFESFRKGILNDDWDEAKEYASKAAAAKVGRKDTVLGKAIDIEFPKDMLKRSSSANLKRVQHEGNVMIFFIETGPGVGSTWNLIKEEGVWKVDGFGDPWARWWAL